MELARYWHKIEIVFYNVFYYNRQKMVKNAGGNKSKKVARKNVALNSAASGSFCKDVRRVSDPSEMYAAIAKIYSARRCDVVGSDGMTYSCTIRGKFLKGKRSGNNALAIGVWVMIGFYDWEVRSDGSKNCDLLEIYTPPEKEKLKQLEAQNLSAIMSIGELAGADKEFAFSHFDNTQAPLGAIDDSSSSSGEEEGEVADKTVATTIVVVGGLKGGTPSAQDQMDWLAIDEKDI